MADNVEITAGSGTPIKTDQIGTDHYQRMKLTDGTPDSETLVRAKSWRARHWQKWTQNDSRC